MNIKIRKFKNGDEIEISKIIEKTLREVNIKDEPIELIEKCINSLKPNNILERTTWTHMYVITDEEKIIGVGSIGPYWDSLTESSLFNIFILPEYHGKKIGRVLIETLENDEYFKRADRIESPASVTAIEFYRHLGYGLKKYGNIIDNEYLYRLEKFPKISTNNNNPNQYNMRPYINNEYHNYYEFIYQLKKEAYQKYVEANFGIWDELKQRAYFEQFINTNKNNTYIIQLNGQDIGFYNGELKNNDVYEIGNICIKKEYQERGIGTQILKDILEKYRDKNIKLQYFKQNKVGDLYKRLGFTPDGETDYHYQLIKPKKYTKIK